MQLSYNFTWTIRPSDHPKFFAYHTRIILYTVPSFCSLWTADVFRVVASLPPKISEGEKRRPEICLQFAGYSFCKHKNYRQISLNLATQKILERDLLKRSKLNAGFTVHILMIIIPFAYKVHRRMSSLTYCHTYCVLHICTLHVDFCEYRSTSKHFLVCVDHCPLRSKQRWVEGFQRRYRSDSGLKLQSKSHYVLIGWMTVLQSNKNYMESTK